MKVQIEVLRAALNKLLDHAKKSHGESVDVEIDLYWFVPRKVLEVPEREPTGLTLGSLEDDWSELEAIGSNGEDLVGYTMVRAASVLRAVGDRTA